MLTQDRYQKILKILNKRNKAAVSQLLEILNALKLIDYISNTKATYVTNGIDIDSGFTTPDIEEALVKEEAIKESYVSFILADHSKFRKVSPVTFSDIGKCCIVTDMLPAPEFAPHTVIKEVMK